MMLEIAVMAACVNGYCNTVGAAYYAQYPYVRVQIDQVKDNLVKQLNKDVIRFAAPIAGAATAGEGTFDLGKGKSISVKVKDSQYIKFTYAF